MKDIQERGKIIYKRNEITKVKRNRKQKNRKTEITRDVCITDKCE